MLQGKMKLAARLPHPASPLQLCQTSFGAEQPRKWESDFSHKFLSIVVARVFPSRKRSYPPAGS